MIHNFFKKIALVDLLIYSLLAIAIGFVFFWNLDAISLRTYDESRQAVNALEMSQNGNLFVTYFDGKPDMWSTKPPLLIWWMAGWMKIIGYHELAVRLPSAIAAAAVVIILFSFIRFYLRDLKAALITSFVLLTCYGFTGIHVARTADFDALLTLWIVLYFISYFFYTEERVGNRDRYLYLTAIFIGLGIFTKGIAAFIPLPSLFFYTLYRKKLSTVFLSKSFYISILIIIFLGLSYYPIRETMNPGFISAVLENEVTGRYLEGQQDEGKLANYAFYLQLFTRTFTPWIYLLPIAFIFTRLSPKKPIRDLGIFSLLFFLFHLGVISYGRRKLEWYCAPEYPIAALLIGLGLSQGIDTLLDSLKIYRVFKRQVISGCLIFGLLFLPSLRMVRNILGSYQYERPNDPKEVQIGYYLRNWQKQPQDGQKISVIDIQKGTIGGRRAHTLFYVKAAKLNGFPVDFRYPDSRFQSGDRLVTCFPEYQAIIENNYYLKTLDRQNTCSLVQVTGEKTTAIP
jgi:4-amino-4-deoxy-L-arabinose transferase-like glycosyltransferase